MPRRLFFPFYIISQGVSHAPSACLQSLRNKHPKSLATLVRDQVHGCVFLTLQHSQLCPFECDNPIVSKRTDAMPVVAIGAKSDNITTFIVVAKLVLILRLVDSVSFSSAIKGVVYHLVLRREQVLDFAE